VDGLRNHNNIVRHENKNTISSQRNNCFQNAASDRDNLKQFLKSNYSQFYKEKLSEQHQKQHNANNIYLEKAHTIQKNKTFRESDYQNTSNFHASLAARNA